MSEVEKIAIGALVALVLFLAPGYLLHVSPRFAGSLAGSMLGIVAVLLMVPLLGYPFLKYLPGVRQRFSRVVSMRTLLQVHIYAGVLAPVLAILHSGHKYDSPMGVTLIGVMIAVVVSGFMGRYYMAFVSAELREQQETLATFRAAYDGLAAAYAEGRHGGADHALSSPVAVRALVDGMADLEFAIASRAALKRVLTRWIAVHGLFAVVLYVILALHIWAEIYYGLGWLP
ncbi:MAG: iron reductase [Alphaproteobacteria bacterium]